MWNFSKHHKICNDGKGNINNIIDTTSVRPDPVNLSKQSSKEEDNPYPSKLPHRKDLHLEPEMVSDSFKETYNLNDSGRQCKINNENFKFIYNRYNSVNTSYESCAIPSHILMYIIFNQKSFKHTH